ncbi:MAG TPA: ribosome small subunit-dependent GTPase A [Clostridia bacterium]|nr:ribosome small subunit-dependent GTPase A [Clostridia bacterium]
MEISNMKNEGFIIKATGGFYYVRCGEETYECRARGIFRKEGISPLCGDRVVFSIENNTGTVTEILPRKNELVRPPVSNLDQLIIVISTRDPEPNCLVIDKLTAIAEIKKIEPVIVFTKTDLESPEGLRECYEKAGFEVICVSSANGMGVEKVKAVLKGKLSAFTGNSGVGKSSLLNRIDSRLGLETGEISHKLGRGRHTTRTVQLYQTGDGGWVADTPGFSSLDIERFETIFKDDLQYAFREFGPYWDNCRFNGCSHIREKDCAVMGAVENGEIPASRYQSYCQLYDQVKGLKEWELKK